MAPRPYVDLMASLTEQVGSALSPEGLAAANVYAVAAAREEYFCGKIDQIREAFNAYIEDRSELNLRNLRRELSALVMAAEMSRISRKAAQ